MCFSLVFRLVDLGSLGEYMSAEDLVSTQSTNMFDRQRSGLESASPLGTILEQPAMESADSFRPRNMGQSVESIGLDELDCKKKRAEHVVNGKVPTSGRTDAVIETKFTKGPSLERQDSEWDRGEGSSSAESAEETPVSEFSESDLESPRVARKGNSRKARNALYGAITAKPAKSLKDRTGGKVVHYQEQSSSRQQRTKQFVRSASVPVSTQFSEFSTHISPPSGFQDLPSIPDNESDSDVSSTDQQSSQNSRPMHKSASPSRQPTSHTPTKSSRYIAVPQIVIEGASDTEETASSRSANTPDIVPDQKDGPSRVDQEPSTAMKQKHRRRLPQATGSREVIGYATPYEEPPLSDVRERINSHSERMVGVVNTAFQDSSVSDGRDRIIYDPMNSSYTNVMPSDSDSAPSGRDENYNDMRRMDSGGKIIYL